MGSVELLVIVSVTALGCSVMPWRERADELVPDAQFIQRLFKESLTLCEFKSVIRLDALNGVGELFNRVAKKQSVYSLPVYFFLPLIAVTPTLKFRKDEKDSLQTTKQEI